MHIKKGSDSDEIIYCIYDIFLLHRGLLPHVKNISKTTFLFIEFLIIANF